MVYSFAVDCNNDSNKTKGISNHRFSKDPMLSTGIACENVPRKCKDFAHQGFCRVLWTLHPHLKSWSFADCFQRNLRAELIVTKSKAILKSGAMPIIFSHRPPPCQYTPNVELRMLNPLIPVNKPGKLIFRIALNSSTFDKKNTWNTNQKNRTSHSECPAPGSSNTRLRSS